MLIQVARFEFRYLLRNQLLWVTAVLTFALFLIGMSVEGFELGSEGGLVMNAAYATLRNYLVVSFVFMFVTTSFVSNLVIRDDETGFGPIIRSTRITKFDYLFGRYLGAFAVAAICLLVVPLAIVIGTMVPWANPAQLGPNRLADHLYGYFLIALPNLLVHSAIFFALATITRSMMATYLGVIGFVTGFFSLQKALDGPQLESAVAIPEPNPTRPDFTGALLYNRLLWIGIAILCLVIAYAAYRFAERGRASRSPAPAEQDAEPFAPASLPSPQHRHAALRAFWMRTRFEIRQVVVSPAFAVLLVWGLFNTFFVLTTQRDPDGLPSYPTTLSMIPEIEDAFSIIPLIVAIYYAGELVWRERDRRIHELVDATPMPQRAAVRTENAG